MDERFAGALREILVAQADHPRRWERWRAGRRRWAAGAGTAIILATAGGGIAYAAGVFRAEPGSPKVTLLAAPVTATGTGTRIVALGSPPARATAISIRFFCLSSGTYTFADGAKVMCTRAAARSPVTYTLSVPPHQDSTTIAATPGARWRLIATYASVSITPWAVNAHGQTYGAQNQHGTPDLVAVIATNHRAGYVYSDQLDPGGPRTPAQALAQNNARPRVLTVYEADGTTPIGRFIVGE